MIGAEIEGRYRVESELGAGGVGTVYRAVHLKLGRPVALKVIQERFGANRELRQRFEREARALAALSHPHIVTVTDYGVLEDTPYLVMELLDGQSLDELLKQGRLEPGLARHVMRQLLSALEFAHGAGLVHRDVKPGNVFLQSVPGSRPHVKLLDFGLAKFVAPEGQRALVTRAGQIVGTPCYMAPEQVAGEGKSASTDVYSAGIIFFEMLAGRAPFDGDAQEVMRQHLLVPLPALESICPDRTAAPELDVFLQRATAKRMQDRFEDAAEMARAFDALPEALLLESCGTSAPGMPQEVPPAVTAPAEGQTTPHDSGEATTLELASAPGGLARARQRIAGAVGRLFLLVVVTISLTAMLGATSVVVVLAKPEVADRWPALTEALRALPGLRDLVPERKLAPAPREATPAAPPLPTSAAAVAAPQPSLSSPEPEAPTGSAADTPAPAAASAATPPAPAAPSPPLWSRIPQPIGRYHRIVETSRPLTKAEMKAVHKYNAAHLDDPRGHLILARSHMRRGWRRDAFVAYQGAFKTSPRAREDVHMLPDLISLVAHGMRDGPELVKAAYGKGALEAVERALGQRHPAPQAARRLEDLRNDLRSL
jgi:eukaryotic-like serine/threonine-protein kinase